MIPLQPVSRIPFTARPSGAIDHAAMERTDESRPRDDRVREGDTCGRTG